MSFIPESWDDPYGAFQANTLLVAAFLEVLKNHCPSARFYQASSSEIFGDPPESPQDEDTPHNPVTPYGVSKLAAHLLAGLYRRRYGMYVASGILYNHESPRRQDHFVTQKIARAAAEISLGRSEKLKLGSIDARRDWGYAGDFVRGIWLMLQQPDGRRLCPRDRGNPFHPRLPAGGFLPRGAALGRLGGNRSGPCPSGRRRATGRQPVTGEEIPRLDPRGQLPPAGAHDGGLATGAIEEPTLSADPSVPCEIEVFPDRSLLSVD